MEIAIAVRDGIFWWVGNWALFTALDACIAIAVVKRMDRNRAEDAEELFSGLTVAIQQMRKANPSQQPQPPIADEDEENNETPAE